VAEQGAKRPKGEAGLEERPRAGSEKWVPDRAHNNPNGVKQEGKSSQDSGHPENSDMDAWQRCYYYE
jgi:hypothetical protein